MASVWDQTTLKHESQFDSYLICIFCMVKKQNLLRQRPDSVEFYPTEIIQWTDAAGIYPLQNCRHIRDASTVRTQSCHSLLYHIPNGFVWIVFCNCRGSDVGTISEFRINSGTFSTKTVGLHSAICTQSLKKTAMKNSSSHARSTGLRQERTELCYDFVPIKQKLSLHSHINKPTRKNRLSFTECYGTYVNIGHTWTISPDHSRSVEICNERILLRSDNDGTFQIIKESNLTF